jgi:hypothetical protein
MPSLPRLGAFEEGATRTAFSFTVGDSSTQGDADVTVDRWAFDFGQLVTANGEFGARLSGGTVDESDDDLGSAGVYGRYWMPHDWWVRPWLEVGVAFAGIESGANDESGWEYAAAFGGTWWVMSGIGAEAFVRQSLGNYDSDEVRSTDFGLGIALLW